MGISLRATILGLLTEKPMCSPQLAQATQGSLEATTSCLARLSTEKRIRFCGFGIDAGFPAHATKPMWGVRDAKPFTALTYEGARIECPACGSHQTYRSRRFHRVECRTCNSDFRDGEKRKKPDAPRRRKANGSGHYAGRITIGRGAKWAWVG